MQVSLFAQTVTVNGCTLKVPSGTFMSTGNMTLANSGAIDNGGTINLTGAWTNNALGLINASLGRVSMVGTSPQSILGVPTVFHHLNINNPTGVVLGSDSLSVNGTLLLQNGVLNGEPAGRSIYIGNTGNVVRVFGWIRGRLSKPVPVGNPTVVFELGNNTTYTSATLSFSAVATAGRYAARVFPGLHPNLGSSCFNVTKYVNQYWRLTRQSVSPANFNATFRYNSSMFVGSPSAPALALAQYSSSSWTYPTISGTPTVTILSATGASGDGDFAIAEGCIAPLNDARIGAFLLTEQPLGTCLNTEGFITGASVSPESNSSVITGEDVWYRFTASEPGVRIVVQSGTFDAHVELQNAAGTTVETENVIAGVGTEMLNHYNPLTPLIPGQTYYIAVRNHNSGIGQGTFNICLQKIADTQCNSGPGPYTMCNTFKCTNTGATNYSFTFTNTTTLQNTVLSTSLGITLVQLGALLPNYAYTVSLSATYFLQNGLGAVETFTIPTPNACAMSMSPHADIFLRSIDQCSSGPKAANAIVGANLWLCGASHYQWRFRQVAPIVGLFGSPISGPSNNRFLNLTAASLAAGATYDVEIRPVFFGNVLGNWGTTRCLQIVGSGGMILENSPENEAVLRSNVEDPTDDVILFPNPNGGHSVSLMTRGLNGKMVVRIMDLTGRIVYTSERFGEKESLFMLDFVSPLSNGLYMVEVENGNESFSRRMIIQD